MDASVTPPTDVAVPPAGDHRREAPALPVVLAILVAHDGADWLPRTLDALAAQAYPALQVMAVDSGSTDDSRDILVAALGAEAVLVAERDLGFGAAVSMAVDTARAAEAEYLLLLHDDCALAPDAVSHLVAAIQRDPRVAIVGPKLTDWDDPRRLQSVGWTVDLTGRADSGLETDELDQGQRDFEHRALYVSTSGMLVRRRAFDELGRFDRRYHLFRDDLDLCWRAWLAGHDVEVVPTAVAHHVGGAANYLRLGQAAFIGPRYFAERNTLATLLKNYGARRLLYVLPLFFLVGIAKVLGFVATRRLSDAWQTVRAWLWNVAHVRRTLRLRREVQAHRTRSDSELRELFGRVVPRIRAYAEAMAVWVAGTDLEIEPEPARGLAPEPTTVTRRAVAFVARYPVIVSALLLTVLSLLAAAPLLAPGSLRGGDLAPWPAGAGAFLGDYLAAWHDAGAMGTAVTPSPAQALLGLLHLMALGNGWLASRLLILGAFPVAWILALRASAGVTGQRLPRVAAATAYVLSPPALAAVRAGRVGALVVLVAIPGLAAAYRTIIRPDAETSSAWRATAAAAIVAAVGAAFEPVLLIVVAAWLVVAVAATLLRPPGRPGRGAVIVRLLSTGVGAVALLVPWSLALIRPGALLGVDPLATGERPFASWLLLAPDGLGVAQVLAGVGFLLAGLLGVALRGHRSLRTVAGLWATALAGVFAAWWLARTGAATWPGLALLVTAGALAGLLAIALAGAGRQLAAHAFGWRQLAALLTGVAIAVGVAASAATMTSGPWGAYAIDQPALPPFIPAEEEEVGAFRVLTLAEREGAVEWDVAGAQGPTMAAFGLPAPDVMVDRVASTVSAIVGGSDPGAAGRLAILNVRYVVVPPGGGSEALEAALAEQVGLEPRPVADGDVYLVSGWLPRGVALSEEVMTTVAARGELPPGTGAVPLERTDDARYAGGVVPGGSLLVSEVAAPGWVARSGLRQLDVGELRGLVHVDVPPGTRADVVVSHERDLGHAVAVVTQLSIVLLAISLLLRPPRFAYQPRHSASAARARAR